MSDRRQSSSSQGNRYGGDYTWDTPNASAVDGCGNRLSDLSLMSPVAHSHPDYTADPTSYCHIFGSSGMSATQQADFANPTWEPVFPNDQSSKSPDYQLFNEAEPISFAPGSFQDIDAGIFSKSGGYSPMDHAAGYTTSNHVSPSSSSPKSKRSTMDDYHGPYGYGEVTKPERKYSDHEVPEKEKRKTRAHGSSYMRTPRSSRRHDQPVPGIDSRNKGVRYSPYPLVISDADLRDPPASSSNGGQLHADPYSYIRSPVDEEEYDMCYQAESPFSTIENFEMSDTLT